ncbi:hypothetical protein F441_04972, partial [Phytophthora nicotianae CJ01A1]
QTNDGAAGRSLVPPKTQAPRGSLVPPKSELLMAHSSLMR